MILYSVATFAYLANFLWLGMKAVFGPVYGSNFLSLLFFVRLAVLSALAVLILY